MGSRPIRKSVSIRLTAEERAALKGWMRYHPRLADKVDSARYVSIAIREIVLERMQKEGLLDPPPISKTGIFARSVSGTSPNKRKNQA